MFKNGRNRSKTNKIGRNRSRSVKIGRKGPNRSKTIEVGRKWSWLWLTEGASNGGHQLEIMLEKNVTLVTCYMWFRYVASLVSWCSLCHEAIVKERFREAVLSV
nr:hypothetical protein [Tanacetum cinerariifolium]